MSSLTLAQLVAERPSAAAILERYGLDYCCGGGQALADACRKRGIDENELLAKIAAEEQRSRQRQSESEANWLQRPLAELCDHIERTHHEYLKSELPRLTGLIEKVVGVHGQRHASLRDVQSQFADLRAELESHMMKEERVLFPAIRALEQSPVPPSVTVHGTRAVWRCVDHNILRLPRAISGSDQSVFATRLVKTPLCSHCSTRERLPLSGSFTA